MKKEGVNFSWTSQVDQDDLEEKLDEPRPSTEADLNRSFQDAKANPDGGHSVGTSASGSSSAQTIRVYLRLKPFPPDVDLTREQVDAYSIVNSTTLLAKISGLDVNSRSLKNLKASAGQVCRTFTFTSAFGPGTSQTELFDGAIKPQVADFLAGRSSTVMSYGTSNAGKSYTLYGVPEAPGMIPLSISFIFREVKATLPTPWFKPIRRGHVIGLSSTERIRELEIRDKLLSFTSPEKTEFVNAYQTILETTRAEDGYLTSRQNENVIYSVWITFAEIYNDVIYDLLSYDCRKKRVPLKMVTDKQGRTFIKDLSMVYVNSEEEAYQILLAGQYRSRIAATTLNPRSSRSHCIFTIKLLKYNASSRTKDVEVSTFSFYDLAGSGRLRMKTNIEDRLKESQNINTSLLVLGRCLKSIRERQSVRSKSEPVGPFRESKLTRLFQEALSGKEQITLIVNVNPIPSLYAETQNVLNFSAIAKKIIIQPVKEAKNIFRSRFSLVVSQSVKSVTDWDHAAVDDSAEMYPGIVKTSDYVHRECYDDLSAEYENLMKEHAALKASMLQKDLEIREEIANTYTGLLKELEDGWRSRSKDVEQQQEHLLAWSVSQVENFYKEKLSRLNSRKRRRWDDGDGEEDRKADIREIETGNAILTAKILVTKETIRELRSAREDAIADKNKAVFELSLVKEEIIGIKKMLEAAENDIQCGGDGACFGEELKRQLNRKIEHIKNLKEFLNEAKEEYIRITSDAGQMQAELKEANAALIENEERIEDLEVELDQANLLLAKRDKEVEQLTGKLKQRDEQLTAAAEKAKNFEKELNKSEFIRLNLMGAVQDLNKLYKTSRANVAVNFNPEIANIESENSPIREHSVHRNRLRDLSNQDPSLEGLFDESIGMQYIDSFIDTESLYKECQSISESSGSSGIDDSGIAMTMGSGNQTMERVDFTMSELKHRGSEFEITLTKDQAGQDDQHKQLLDNVDGLLALKKQLHNWLMREFENKILNSRSELKTGLESTIDEVDEQFSSVKSDLHRSEDVEISGESTPKVATETEEDVYADFCGFHQFDDTSDSQESKNFKIWFQDKGVERIHRFMNNAAFQDDKASINADYLHTAPASIPWGAVSHFDAKSTITAGLNETSAYSPNRVDPDDRKSYVTENKLFQQEAKFGAREILLILILTIVFLVGLM